MKHSKMKMLYFFSLALAKATEVVSCTMENSDESGTSSGAEFSTEIDMTSKETCNKELIADEPTFANVATLL